MCSEFAEPAKRTELAASRKIPREAAQTATRLCGEYAWLRSDLSSAVRAFVAAGLAILGVEVWVARPITECDAEREPTSKKDILDPEKSKIAVVAATPPGFVVYAAVATRDCDKPCFTGWRTAKNEHEPWSAFVSRSAKEFLSWLGANDIEGRVLPQFSAYVYYNVAVVSEREYEELGNWGD